MTHKEQQTSVFPERAHTASKADDEHGEADDDEDEGWVKSNVGQFAEVGQGVFLCPGPQSNSQQGSTKQLWSKQMSDKFVANKIVLLTPSLIV